MKPRQKLHKIENDIITLHDGSVWKADASAADLLQLWSAPFDEIEIDTSKSALHPMMTNLKKSEVVRVEKIG